MSTSAPPTSRRRGAQPGNGNRIKHGLYSREAKSRRANMRILVPLMAEAIEAVHAFEAARRDWNAAPVSRRRKRESDNRMAVLFFQSLRMFSEQAEEAAPWLFEPRPPAPSGTAQSANSNDAGAAPDWNATTGGTPLPQDSTDEYPSAAFEDAAPSAESVASASATAFEPRPHPAIAPEPDRGVPIPWWTKPRPALRYRP